MSSVRKYLAGGDLRSVGKVNQLIKKINGQPDFNLLMQELESDERVIAMRAADAIEKISIQHKELLQPHKEIFLDLLKTDAEKEIRWHLAQIIPRLKLNEAEIKKVWEIFSRWALNRKESRIVRVNSIQGLFELRHSSRQLRYELEAILKKLENENVPSIKARIKKLRKE